MAMPGNPIGALVRQPNEDEDQKGHRTVRHVGPGVFLASVVDKQGRLMRQELVHKTDVIIWQHGSRVRTGILTVGSNAQNAQFDGQPSRLRLDRARQAFDGYRGEDKYILHLSKVVSASTTLALSAAEFVTGRTQVLRAKLRAALQERARLSRRLAVAGAVVAALLALVLWLRR